MGSFRFYEEFSLAANLLNENVIDVTPMLSHELPIEKADKAFQLAGDRSKSVKVLLNLEKHTSK